MFSGGGLHTEAAITLGVCSGVQMSNNAATSFGGAFTSFAGSDLRFTDSDFSDNASGFYGGGILALYGNATVKRSKINRNRCAGLPAFPTTCSRFWTWSKRGQSLNGDLDSKQLWNACRSTYGGGATKALAGSLFLDGCEVANNTANAGAGIEIAGAAGYITVVGVSNTVISGNAASLQGAAFNLGSTNATTFTNVSFINNVGTS